MKALTVRQPWAWLIIHAGKRVENRTWCPPRHMLGQRIAIHASKRVDLHDCAETFAELRAQDMLDDVAEKVTLRMLQDGSGSVLGVATLLGWLDARQDLASAASVEQGAEAHHVYDLDEDPWWIGPVGWLLRDVRAIEPVPCKGALGLWELQAEVEHHVLRALER